MSYVGVTIPLGENKPVAHQFDSSKNGAKRRYEVKLEVVQLKESPYRLPAEIGIEY